MRKWSTPRLTYSWIGTVPATLSEDQIATLVDQAFEAWSIKQLSGSAFQFRYVPTKLEAPTSSKGVAALTSAVDILIVFTTRFASVVPTRTKGQPDPKSRLAVTVEPTPAPIVLGRMVILVDSLQPLNQDLRRLQHVIRHEIGHALGLEHSPVNAFPYSPPLLPAITPLPILPMMTSVLFEPRNLLHPDDQAWGQDMSSASFPSDYGSISGEVVDAVSGEGVNGVQVVAVEVTGKGTLPSDLSQFDRLFACVTPYGPTVTEYAGRFRIVVPNNRTFRVIVRSIPVGYRSNRVNRNGNEVSGEHNVSIPVKGDATLPRPIRATVRILQ